MNVARLAARGIVGGLFVGHGMQKLAGWFGGPGLEGTEGMMRSLEMHPPRRNAVAAGVTETAGGVMLVAGLATPVACAGLIGTMITAIRKVHWPSGPWASAGGYEYNLVLIAGLLALAEEGPGDISLDSALGLDMRGIRWSLAALAVGAAASAATIKAGERGQANSTDVAEQPGTGENARPEGAPMS
jgi:putative oxidoreductase